MEENTMEENKTFETENVSTEATASTAKTKFGRKLDNYFGITKSGSTFKIEVIAGITTFMTMVYILFVNAGIFADLGSVSYGAIYIATALASIVGTVLIGLLSKLPLAQSVGMG